MKFCKDCIHFRPMSLECSKNPTVSLVTGKTIYTYAHEYRNTNYFEACGRMGKWFEPKVFEPTSIEDADLDDLSKIPFGK